MQIHNITPWGVYLTPFDGRLKMYTKTRVNSVH